MSSSILEQIRSSHELAEVLEASISVELDKKSQGQKGKVIQQHIISRRIDEISKANAELQMLYGDKDKLLKNEIAGMVGNDAMMSFYDALNAKSEYHKTNSTGIAPLTIPNPEHVNTPVDDVAFSGEELWGKYLDLHTLHSQYCNLKSNSSGSDDNDNDNNKIEYYEYINIFLNFNNISNKLKYYKNNKPYLNYVHDIYQYLYSHIVRTQPLSLLDMNEIYNEWENDFEDELQKNDNDTNTNTNTSSVSSDVRPEHFDSIEQLEQIGTEQLKKSLESRGLKSGGTLKDRANRLWAVRGLSANQIPAKLLAKKSQSVTASATNTNTNSDSDSNSNSNIVKSDNIEFTDKSQQILWGEYRCKRLEEILEDVIQATQQHAEKQLTRTLAERNQEIDEEEKGFGYIIDDGNDNNDDYDGSGPTYNPGRMFLGVDGKPIPHWLYKLQGLRKEYKCEICSDEIYKGKKAFDKHFTEARHSHGMRLLGIPNTKHFHDITSIEDAYSLYEKIKNETNASGNGNDRNGSENGKGIGSGFQEYEDAEGNVFRA
jgi:splicing factor 3A subunit 3